MTEVTITTKHKLTYQVYACWSEEGGMGEETYGEETGDLSRALQLICEARAKGSNFGGQKGIEWFLKTTVVTTSTPRT